MTPSPFAAFNPAAGAPGKSYDEAFPDVLEERLRRLWALNGEPFDEVAEALGQEPDDLLASISELLDIGVLSVINGTLRMTTPRIALADLLAQESATLQSTIDRLLRMGAIVARLGGESPANVSRPRLDPGESWLDAQVLRGLPEVEQFRAWVADGGDLRFLRPEHWRLPTEPHIAEAFAATIGRGNSVRCIYPVEAVRLARNTLDSHVAFGEQVRLLPEVPFQLALFGSEMALVLSGLGDATRTVVLRDPVVVGVLDAYFDQMWADAVAMPLGDEVWDRDDERQVLLGELARGTRDEQIAKVLGVSLRTVRRRVADLMVELEAETRFQAGVEATRRGWV